MKKGIYILLSLLLILPEGYSQNGNGSMGGWNLTKFNGEVNLRGLYRDRYTTIKDFKEYQESLYYSGGIKLNTSSYIWHPSFLQIDFGGEYSPESNRDEYLVTPDRSEVRTLKGLNGAVTVFANKPVTLKTFLNLNESYSNRENLTNIRSNSKRWGGSVFLRNKILPLSITYNDLKWDQEEIDTGRKYKLDQSTFEVSTKKSFGWRDRNKLSYSHIEYFRRDANLFEIRNKTDNIRLNNNIILNKEKGSTFRSMIYNYKRRGNQDFNILNATESLLIKLPNNFDFRSTYTKYFQQQELNRSDNDKVSVGINHKLFASLFSELKYEYSSNKHSLYKETRSRPTANIRYTKKIPSGTLNVFYSFSNLRNEMESDPVLLPVLYEEYLFGEIDVIVLSRPYIDVQTLVLRDISGTIIYQPGLDYTIFETGNFIEINRMPGGQILERGKVYADYTARQEGSYKYNSISNNINANIILFNRLLELYYRGQFLDYKNVEKSDLLILNYLRRNIYGGKINVGFVELGAEYEDHNSTITPYIMMHYFVNISKRFKRLLFSIHGNWRDYKMLDAGIDRLYADLSVAGSYQFNPRTKIEVNAGYRHQKGPGIDLNLLTARAEFITSYRQVYLTIGAQRYDRNYLNDLMNYNSVYIRISRRF